MTNNKLLFEISFFIILVFLSCKKENNNTLPIADAGENTTIRLPQESVMLDGRASYHPGGRISTWQWSKISGPSSFTIVHSSDSVTEVKDLAPGFYRFELKVTDDGNQIGVDTVKITVYRAPYQAEWTHYDNAGPDSPPFYLFVPDSANYFLNVLSKPPATVWVKQTSTSNWEPAAAIRSGNAAFSYSVGHGGIYIDQCEPWDSNLTGKKAEVEIRLY